MAKSTFAYIQDPGHGWLEVPRRDIDELGIHSQISVFSYIQGQTAYLEEDCDMSVFLLAYEAAHPGVDIDLKEIHVNTESKIRNYRSYPSLKRAAYLRSA